ncbi:MAG: hypothetical protein IKF82_08305 [Bacilli bacterium]|nr:hypothetical protein [Bacilli bacterium]
MKKFYFLIVVLLVAFFNIGSVKADVTVVEDGVYRPNDTDLYFQDVDGNDYKFLWRRLKTSPGNEIVYCYDANRDWPEGTGEDYDQDTISPLDPGLIYILNYGKTNPDNLDANLLGFVVQGTIYLYNSGSGVRDFANRKPGVGDDILQRMLNLRSAAYSATASDIGEGNANISFENVSSDDTKLYLSSNGNYYISGLIKPTVVNSSTYTVSATGVNGVVIIDSSGNSKTTFSKNEGFYIKVPSNISGNISVNVEAKVSTKSYLIDVVNPKAGDERQQRIIGLFNEPVEISDSITLTPTVCVNYEIVGSVKPDDSVVPAGECITRGDPYNQEPDPTTKTKCVFKGWYTSYDSSTGKLSGSWTDGDNLDEDMTLYGKWDCPPVVEVPPTAAQTPFIVLGCGLVSLAAGIGYYVSKQKK